MLPVSIVVAAIAMGSGVGGAAFFMPIFLIVFPLLGPEHNIGGPTVAVSAALLTQTVGFASAFAVYFRRRLIDFRIARIFSALAVPAAVAGSMIAHAVTPLLIHLAYGILMLAIASTLFRKHDRLVPSAERTHRDPLREDRNYRATPRPLQFVQNSGHVYTYSDCRPGRRGTLSTGVGGLLTGLLGVGIGEVVMPQLLRRQVALPVAAATSVAISILTVAVASVVHVTALIAAGGWYAFPWDLVAYTVPGVIIGGQIGPRLQNRFDARVAERLIGRIFGALGIAMLWVALRAVL